MKKILVLSIFISLSGMLHAALSGSGTFASPFNGTFEGDLQWNSTNFPSGKVYINGDVIIDNEQLTIEAGMIIVFVSEGADLRITGTGQLNASGTSGSMITFTADDDDDGNYGETGERWGHVTFESMGAAGSSVIDNCIIEYGYKDIGDATPESFGGGIYAGFTDLTISNCLIRNNHAGYGGGIFIKNNTSPGISNNKIYSNTVSKGGGGIFVHNGVSSLITNCLIYNNSCSGSGGGGGIFLGPDVLDTKIINSTITKNTTLYPSTGNNINFLQNTQAQKPSFTNCIIWGSNNSITYVNQTSSANDFINCAIEGTIALNYTNCINLNITNTNATGPNFIATDGSDWSIQPWSPCADIGNGTDPDVPSLDYDGNSRIGSVDVGAYESQYYRWQGDDGSNPDLWTVAENWNSGSVPPSGVNTIIPSNLTYYPTASSPDITIGSGNALVIRPGARASIGTLTNNGTLRLHSSSVGTASLIITTYSKGGGSTEDIQLYLTGGGTVEMDNFKWHYISSPVSSLAVSTFAPGTTLDVAQFVESRPVFSLLQGWVAYDGYVYSTGISNGPTFSNFTVGKGYNFWDDANNTFTFSGTLNTANVPMSLSYSGTPSLNGFNLLGNPFCSGLDWDAIADGYYFTYPDNTSKGIYFTRNNTQCTYIRGVGIPGDVTGIIPPMQGFFTKTYSTGNTITLAAAARTNDDIHIRYKKGESKGSEIIPLVRLKLERDTIADETVVRFNETAKSGLDNDFDAIKLYYSDTTKTLIYSFTGGTNYAINGQPFPDSLLEVPIIINITKDTIHTISATQLQGLGNYYVYLKDNYTGFTVDLKETSELSFTGETGITADRFVLKISTFSTGPEDPEISQKQFAIYYTHGYINIQPLSDNWNEKTGSVNIFDITGKVVKTLDYTEFIKNSLIQIPFSGSKGMYLIDIRSGGLRFVGKVVI